MSKFYYNGVLLPVIPSEHLGTNPFVFIRDNSSSGYYDLIMCSKDLYYADNGVRYNDDSTAVQYMYRLSKSSYLDATEWEFNKEVSNTYFNIGSSQVVLWSNSTIYITSVGSSTIHFPKCELYPDSDKKMLFNDVLLPPIPLEYIATNPFVFIRKNNTSGYYDLLLGTACWYYDSSSSGVRPKNTSDTQYWYRIPILTADSCAEWEFNQSLSSWYGLDSNRTLLWTLQDISNGQSSSSIYAYGTSSTVPEETLTKYLIRNNSTIYTVIDGALSELTGELTASLFQTSGVDAIPDGALLIGLSNPDVLCWTDSDTLPTLTATVQGVPQGTHEIISDEAMIGHESVYGVFSVEATASDGATFFLSFDGGVWMVYDTDSSTWTASDVGMTAAELIAIPENAWSSVVNSAQTMRLKAVLDGIDTVTQVKFNFNNDSPV